MQRILLVQSPEQFAESVPRLLQFLHTQGIATAELEKKVISQVIARRAQKDAAFQNHLLRWERTAPERDRLSTIGQAVRLALAFLEPS